MLREVAVVSVRQTAIACGVDRVPSCSLQMAVWMPFILSTTSGSHFSLAVILSHLNLGHLQPSVLILGEPLFVYDINPYDLVGIPLLYRLK